MGDVQVGMSVEIRVLAYPGRGFHGEVVLIAPKVLASDRSMAPKQFVVTTDLRNEDRLLKSGMTGKAKIRCGDRKLGQLIMRKLSHYARIEFWSWW